MQSASNSPFPGSIQRAGWTSWLASSITACVWLLLFAGNGLSGEPVFQPPASPPRQLRPLQIGAAGKLVEDLQRTLNARLKPSGDLSLDGDFGPATRAAVERFQRQRRLPVTGVVDQRTWSALAPLVTHEKPVRSPGEINQQVLPRRPPEDLAGPPAVSCQAWVIVDAKSGEPLWGARGDEPRDIASTTKIMTALVVLDFVRDQPDKLNQIVRISERADATRGSSARLRTGDKLPVDELLYGLLLPSGNDAAIALAEHFGGRLIGDRVDTLKEPGDPVARFVAAMNGRAAELKMTNTSFKNPHGLTADGHRSCAADLAKLAVAAMRLPRFRRYVATRQRGCEVENQQGERRNVLWKNTNRLLEIDGYLGIKTGTTSAAGACLVAAGTHRGDQLLVVVLGSASSASRYVDARNLFRWAWRKRR